MKRIVSYLILLVAALVGLSSCGTVEKVKTYRPDEIKDKVHMCNLKFVGETEVEISYRNYLGFIHALDKVNGEDYDDTNKKVVKIKGVHGNLKKACYKVVEQYPNARYFQIIKKTKIADRIFLGSHVTVKAIIRAYEIK